MLYEACEEHLARIACVGCFYRPGEQIWWQDQIVEGLVQSCFHGSCWNELPILADRLQDIGVDDHLLLRFLRNPCVAI
jgi:hypothetical protein